MSKCTIDIPINESIDELIEKAKKSIESESDGEFDGNSKKGKYSISTSAGTIKGTYRVKDESIHLKITDKPMLVTCDKIEDKLKEKLSSKSD